MRLVSFISQPWQPVPRTRTLAAPKRCLGIGRGSRLCYQKMAPSLHGEADPSPGLIVSYSSRTCSSRLARGHFRCSAICHARLVSQFCRGRTSVAISVFSPNAIACHGQRVKRGWKWSMVRIRNARQANRRVRCRSDGPLSSQRGTWGK